MSGYRQSSFDPIAGGEGMPMRPFNKWQWVGVGLVGAGVFVMVAQLAGRLGWAPMKGQDLLPIATTLCAFGAVLIGSRREPVELTSEQSVRLRRRKLIIIGIAALVFAIALGVTIFLKGA